MKRLFIGVPVSCDKAVAIINDWQTNHNIINNRILWTKFSNWHITLVFLGAYPESVIPQIIAIINKSFENCKTFSSPLSGVGVFPDKRKPNVLWLGIETIQPLQESYEKLVNLLNDKNFLFDQKPLKPHLTVARIKYLANRTSLNELIDEYKDFNFGHTSIDRIILYESISASDGVKYIPLYEKTLENKI